MIPLLAEEREGWKERKVKGEEEEEEEKENEGGELFVNKNEARHGSQDKHMSKHARFGPINDPARNDLWNEKAVLITQLYVNV